MASKKAATSKKRTVTSKKSKLKASTFDELVDLTPDEIKRLPKPRDGFEDYVTSILSLYAAQPELYVSTLSASEVEGRFRAFQTLKPLEASAAKHLEMVQETRLLHGSKTWSAMLEIYAKAKVAARTNPEIARGIADFAAFMKLGPRKPQPAK